MTRLLLPALALLGSVFAFGQAPASAPPSARPAADYVGQWLLPATGPEDLPTAVGLELTLGDGGRLAGRFTYTALHYYGIPLGKIELQPDGRYQVVGDAISFRLDADGVLQAGGFGEQPVPLRRVSDLPRAPQPPDVPAGPGPLWRTRLGGPIFAPAAVRDGFAYVGNNDGAFFAVKIADGSVAWSFAAGRPVFGEALATDDAVYFTCDNGYLFKLNRADGKEAWRYDLGDGRIDRVLPNPHVFNYDWRSAQPLLVDGTIYLGARDASFHAVDATTGQPVWRISSNAAIATAAVAHGANVIFATQNGWICAVDRASSREVWSHRRSTAYTSGPALHGDLVVAGNRGSRFRALDARTGEEKWNRSWWGSWIESTPVFADGRGYVGSGDLYLVAAFDPATGRFLWRTHVHGWVLQRLALTTDRIFAGVSGARRRNDALLRQEHALDALDRETGRLLWSWRLPDLPGAFLGGFVAAPVVADDRVIVGGTDGTLYAFPAH